MSITFAPFFADDRDFDADLPDLNVSIHNGYALLAMLGLMPQEGQEVDVFGLTVIAQAGYGEVDAADFAGRVLIAQALLDSGSCDAQGTPTYTVGNITYCGREPGYLAVRLGILADIAAWAVRHQARMRWF